MPFSEFLVMYAVLLDMWEQLPPPVWPLALGAVAAAVRIGWLLRRGIAKERRISERFSSLSA
jgi:hypothetical protein